MICRVHNSRQQLCAISSMMYVPPCSFSFNACSALLSMTPQLGKHPSWSGKNPFPAWLHKSPCVSALSPVLRIQSSIGTAVSLYSGLVVTHQHFSRLLDMSSMPNLSVGDRVNPSSQHGQFSRDQQSILAANVVSTVCLCQAFSGQWLGGVAAWHQR